MDEGWGGASLSSKEKSMILNTLQHFRGKGGESVHCLVTKRLLTDDDQLHLLGGPFGRLAAAWKLSSNSPADSVS